VAVVTGAPSGIGRAFAVRGRDSVPGARSRLGHRAAMTSPRTAATAAALTTLGSPPPPWLVAVRQMNGMDMSVATERGSFLFFVTAWLSMRRR
jgi:hypothetical protein